VQKLVDLKAMAYRFLVVPVAGVLGLGGYGEEGKRERRRRRGTRSGAHPLQRGVVVTGFCRDGEDGALCHGELLEPVLLGITGMCAGEKVILGIPKQGAFLWVVYIFVWSCHERLV